jgi:hypothetical protein
MKKFAVLLAIIITGMSCSSQNEKKEPVAVSPVNNNDIEVFYFHMTTRCATCRAVEAEARKNIEMLYPAEYNSGKITFTALNIDEEAGKFMGSQYDVSGQTLLIVMGDQKFNITKEGFLYAEGKPDKFKSVIKEKVDSLLNE